MIDAVEIMGPDGSKWRATLRWEQGGSIATYWKINLSAANQAPIEKQVAIRTIPALTASIGSNGTEAKVTDELAEPKAEWLLRADLFGGRWEDYRPDYSAHDWADDECEDCAEKDRIIAALKPLALAQIIEHGATEREARAELAQITEAARRGDAQ